MNTNADTDARGRLKHFFMYAEGKRPVIISQGSDTARVAPVAKEHQNSGKVPQTDKLIDTNTDDSLTQSGPGINYFAHQLLWFPSVTSHSAFSLAIILLLTNYV